MFGHKLLSEFQFEEGYLCLNHGSFESTPKCVTEQQHTFQRCCDMWFRKTVYELLRHEREEAARFYECGRSKFKCVC